MIAPQRIKQIVSTIMIITCTFLIMTGTGFARGKKGEWKLPSHYPDGFDGFGCLMSIDQGMAPEKTVIDDSQKKLSPELTFHTPDGSNMPLAYIVPNSLVGYILNDSNQIVSIWLISETCENQ